jgi:putative oxidoreductase
MRFRGLERFVPLGLLLLRLMVGVVFIDSGWRDLRAPQQRSTSIGESKGFTIALGCAELAGGTGVVLGVLQQPAAAGLILIMLGAIYKKAFVWHTGFWGQKTFGWHYDLMLLVMSLVILFTNGGPYALTKSKPMQPENRSQ